MANLLIAKRSLIVPVTPSRSKTVEAGEAFECDDDLAAALVAAGKAEKAGKADKPVAASAHGKRGAPRGDHPEG